MQAYRRVHSVHSKYSVTNDAAECEVKLAHDKLGSTPKETRYQNITQAVKHHRAAVCVLRIPIKNNAVFDSLTIRFSVPSSMMFATALHRMYITRLSYVLCIINKITQFLDFDEFSQIFKYFTD